ncbi:MAG: hypothetical protein KatS3mg052_2378 [Candidatus Roseilinea sp.]|nr:MAG: hypothetical protein KatS3mg052_2378 [Candidatus Roseilinea sp.]
MLKGRFLVGAAQSSNMSLRVPPGERAARHPGPASATLAPPIFPWRPGSSSPILSSALGSFPVGRGDRPKLCKSLANPSSSRLEDTPVFWSLRCSISPSPARATTLARGSGRRCDTPAGSSSSRRGTRFASVPSATSSSSRANGAPTQKWMPPPERDVGVVGARDVQRVGVCKASRVSVGGAEQKRDCVAEFEAVPVPA